MYVRYRTSYVRAVVSMSFQIVVALVNTAWVFIAAKRILGARSGAKAACTVVGPTTSASYGICTLGQDDYRGTYSSEQ